MDTQQYSRFTNKATWLVKNWLDNNETSYNHMFWLAEEYEDKNSLAKAIEEYLAERRESSEEVKQGFFGDLVTYAISQVDFGQIAQMYLEDLQDFED